MNRLDVPAQTAYLHACFFRIVGMEWKNQSSVLVKASAMERA